MKKGKSFYTKSYKNSGALSCESLGSASSGGSFKRHFGSPVELPLSYFVRDPMQAMRLSNERLRLLVRQALYRIRALEGKEECKILNQPASYED